ncbi:MAG: prenyltransferase [Methanomicrobiales archaeon]|jgi:1,4-dihydroxy-2-naphthoate octaprenyltransferase
MDLRELAAFIRMGRLPLLFGGLLYYLLGALTAVAAGYPLQVPRILIGYAILGPAHLSVHFSNDYFDIDGDRRGRPTAVSGGSGVLAGRPDPRPRARSIALLLIAISFIAGIWAYFTVLPTPFLPALLVLGNGIGWFYSAPPVRLSSRGLGEAATAIAIGLLIPGMGYLVIAGSLGLSFLFAMLPLLLYGVAFILAVEIPDRQADALSGKRTFIVRNGVPAGMLLALAATFLAIVLYSTAPLTGILPPAAPVGVIALVSFIPLASTLPANLREPRDEGDLMAFAQHTVLSLIAFAVLTDACLLFTALRG